MNVFQILSCMDTISFSIHYQANQLVKKNIDYFVSEYNAKLLHFYSRLCCNGTLGVDAFNCDWSKGCGLIVPSIINTISARQDKSLLCAGSASSPGMGIRCFLPNVMFFLVTVSKCYIIAFFKRILYKILKWRRHFWC